MWYSRILNAFGVPGYRWSLYVVQNDQNLHCAMHSNNVLHLLGYSGTELKGKTLKDEFTLGVNYNALNDRPGRLGYIPLSENDFNEMGFPTTALFERVEAIDPGYQTGAEHFDPEWVDMSSGSVIASAEVDRLIWQR
jgi:hypothetical protein